MKSDSLSRLVGVEREVKGHIMKTDIFIRILGLAETQQQMENDLHQAFKIFEDFERRFSRFQETSELTRFNRSGGGPVSPELFEMLDRILDYHEKTKGLFDPSVLPYLDETGYHGAPLLAAGDISIGTLQLDRNKCTATKPLGLVIDLGGIAKGAAVDAAVEFLHTAGYQDFIIDAGGDMYVSGGNRLDGYPYWAIDVEDPFHPDHPVGLVLLSDTAIATSGRNRRSWRQEGEIRHHLIDPRTKNVSDSELETISLIDSTTTAADVWAKTFFLLGEEAGYNAAVAEKKAAFFILGNGRKRATPEWEKRRWRGDESAGAIMA